MVALASILTQSKTWASPDLAVLRNVPVVPSAVVTNLHQCFITTQILGL